MRVFLTGGSGLLGSHLAAHLCDRGHEVVALHRSGSDTHALKAPGCRLVVGDVRHGGAALAPLMDGCTHIVHAAALVYRGTSWPEIRAVNVEGVRNVLEAAAAAGVRHAVYVSSVTVYGAVEGPVDESSPVDSDVPARDLYARSKREGERAARTVEASHGLPVTVLRPSGLYGEGDRLLSVRVARTVRYGVAFTLGSGRNTVPAVYAGNLAVAVRLAMEAERGRTTYDVGCDHPLTQRALLKGIARGMGRRPMLVPLPEPLVRAGADVLGALGLSVPGVERLPLGRAARLAMRPNPYGARRIREELGWEPPHRHEDALVRTGRWLRAAGAA